MVYLAVYILFCIVFVALYERGREQTRERFFVANRRIAGLLGALSIAASWVWAPALFVSTEVGFKYGFSGLFWFTVPNVLALCLFAPFAAKVRRTLPVGFSYIEYVRTFFGAGFFKAQLAVQMFVQIICYAIQLTAGGKLLAYVSGMDESAVILLMGIGPLLYTRISGVSASILTDALQYVVMVVCIAALYYGLGQVTDFSLLRGSDFAPLDPSLMVEFGLASALTLLFGIFSDNQQWQRAFSVRRSITAVFIGGGVLHGLITASLGTVGVLLALSGYMPSGGTQIVGAEYVHGNLPPFYTAAFVVLVLCGLCSTLDSALCAFSSLYAAHIRPGKDPIAASREGMKILVGGSLMIALGGFPLIALWMFAGLLRLCTVIPTVLSIVSAKFRDGAAVLAILVPFIACAPLFIYASHAHLPALRLAAMAGCLALSGLILAFSLWESGALRRKKTVT